MASLIFISFLFVPQACLGGHKSHSFNTLGREEKQVLSPSIFQGTSMPLQLRLLVPLVLYIALRVEYLNQSACRSPQGACGSISHPLRTDPGVLLVLLNSSSGHRGH